MVELEPPTLDALAQLVAGALGVEPGMLFRERSFAEQSIGASELERVGRALQRSFGVEPPDMIRQCASLAQLHEWLAATRDASGRELHLELGFAEGIPDALYYE